MSTPLSIASLNCLMYSLFLSALDLFAAGRSAIFFSAPSNICLLRVGLTSPVSNAD